MHTKTSLKNWTNHSQNNQPMELNDLSFQAKKQFVLYKNK